MAYVSYKLFLIKHNACNSVEMNGLLHPLISHETRRTLAQSEGCFFCSKSFSTGEAKHVWWVIADSMRRLEAVMLNVFNFEILVCAPAIVLV